MALPLIGLIALLLLSVIMFVVGVSRYNVNTSLGFIVFGSVILLVSSMFIMNEGLQLDTTESFTDEGNVTSVTYQTVSYNPNSYDWLRVLTDVMFYGSFIGIIFGFAFNLKRSQDTKKNCEWAI